MYFNSNDLLSSRLVCNNWFLTCSITLLLLSHADVSKTKEAIPVLSVR